MARGGPGQPAAVPALGSSDLSRGGCQGGRAARGRVRPRNARRPVAGRSSVIDSVFRAQDQGAAYFAVAQNGTLIFTPGGYARTLVRVDRHGRRYAHSWTESSGVPVSGRFHRTARRVVVTIDPRPSQIWVYDLARKTRSALATDAHSLAPAVDARRGRHRLRLPRGRLLRYLLGGTPMPAAPLSGLLERDGPQFPTSWSERRAAAGLPRRRAQRLRHLDAAAARNATPRSGHSGE